MISIRPPRLPSAVVQRCLPPAVAEPILGDLEEDFAEWVSEIGLRRAQGRYWKFALLGVWHARRDDMGRRTSRDGGRGRWMSSWRGDSRYAYRAVSRRPEFSVAVIVMLATGIGANVAVFSVVETVLLRPLPYADADRIRTVWTSSKVYPPSPRVSGPDFFDLRERSQVLEGVEAGFGWRAALKTADGAPRGVQQARVTSGFLAMLGITPALGQPFGPEHDAPESQGVALLSHRVWMDRFGGAKNVVGQSIELDGEDFRIVGVLPRAFRMWIPPETAWAIPVDVWVNLRYDRESFPRAQRHLLVLGKVRPGVPAIDVERDAESVSEYVRTQLARYEENVFTFSTMSLQEGVVRKVRPTLLALLAASAVVVLLIAANVGNLFAAASWARTGEFRVRRALGASGGRLLRQSFLETALLTAPALGAGIAVAWAATLALSRHAPGFAPVLESARLSPPALGYALGLTALCTVGLGLLPTVLSGAMASAGFPNGRTTLGSSRSHTVTAGLVMLQVALSVMLLVGSALLVKTVAALNRADLGFDPRGAMSFTLQIPRDRYEQADRWGAFVEGIEAELASIPGIEAVGMANALPLMGAATGAPFTFRDVSDQAVMRVTSPGYLDAIGGRLLAGRYLTHQDRSESATVAVINETLARMIGMEPRTAVGQVLTVFRSQASVEVVGVMADIPSVSVAAPRRPSLFFPYYYFPAWAVRMVMRGDGAGSSMALASERIASVDPDVSIDETRPLVDYVASATELTRLAAGLLVLMGTLGAGLAGFGLYAVLAYVTKLRSREVGLRIALGATPAGVLLTTIGRGVGVAAAGIAFGLAGAVAVGRLLANLLYGTNALDPWVYAVPVAATLLISVVACLGPATRASAVDPAVVLRSA